MEQFIGCDAHKKFSVFVAVNEKGQAGEAIYPTRSLDTNALIQPQSRQTYARLLAQGWTDALRKLQPEGPLWTFWDYERNRWPLDKGMRLDHFLLSPTACDLLVHGV